MTLRDSYLVNVIEIEGQRFQPLFKEIMDKKKQPINDEFDYCEATVAHRITGFIN